MKHLKLICPIILFFATNVFPTSFIENLETHKCPDINYNYGVFKSSSNAYWWTYINARNAAESKAIQGKSLMLKSINGSIQSSQIKGGISTFSFQMNKCWSSTVERTFKVEIFNKNSGTTTTYTFSKPGVETDNETFTITGINIEGLFTIKIQNTTNSTAIVVDNITWESYNDTATYWTPNIWTEFNLDKENSILYDYSYAGYKSTDEAIPDVMVKTSITNYGAVANDSIDDTKALQDAIDYVSSLGGGAVEIPVGKFLLGEGSSISHVKIPSNVVIRGEGNTEQGSILFISSLVCSESNCSYGQGVLSTANDDFIQYPSKTITATSPKGTYLLSLNNTSELNSGDAVRVRMYNPNVNGTRTNDLSLLLTNPLTPEPQWTNYTKYAPFECVFVIDEIINSTTIKLKQPLMQEISIDWIPKLEPLNFIEGVGIENLRIESAFAGDYSHHKNWEVDYGWSAIYLHNARNSWVRDVVIEDMTQDIQLNNSMNITIERVIIDGKNGHHGIKLNNSWFNLVKDCYIKTYRTHAIGVANMAHGNVFTNIAIDNPDGMIDFHGGGFSSNNLFEKINNTHVDSGGAIQNMPHAGQYNTFWNIISNTTQVGKPGLDFFSGYYNYDGNPNPNGTPFNHENFKLYPKSIMVGVYDPEYLIEIDYSTSDRNDEWLYNEGFNQANVFPESLYEAQKSLSDETLVLNDDAFPKVKKSYLVYQTNDKLYLKQDLGKTNIIIYDISGRTVAKYSGNLLKNNPIPIQLKRGFYIVKATKNKSVVTQKIIFK